MSVNEKKGFLPDAAGLFIVFSCLLLIGLGALYIFYGTIHVDEGYYHLMGRLVLEGRQPYQDFFAVQGPIYPYYLAPWIACFGSSLEAARFSSFFLLFLTFLLAVRLARKHGGKGAAVMTAGLLAFNLFLVYYSTIVKLYALTGFLIMAGFSFYHARRFRFLSLSLGLCCLAAASAVRISVLPGYLFFLAYVLVFGRERTARRFSAAVISLMVLGALLFPFYAAAPEQFVYGLYTYHTVKDSNFSLAQQLTYKIDALINLVRSFFLLMLLVSAGLLSRWLIPEVKTERTLPSGAAAGWIFMLIITLVHFSAASPRLNNYSVIIIPLAVFYISVYFSRTAGRFFDREAVKILAAVFVFACFLTAFIHGRENLSWMKGRGSAGSLRDLAGFLSLQTNEDQSLLLYQNSLAVMAGRPVVPGFEMNTLSYAPFWDRTMVEKYMVLNTEALLKKLRSGGIGAVAITEHTFLGNFPVFYNPGEEGARGSILEEIERHYRKVKTIPGLGYFNTPVDVYLPAKVMNRKEE